MVEPMTQRNNPAPDIDPLLQQQLNEIGGLMLDGRPKLRLVWGQDPQTSIFWEGRQRLRYLLATTREFVGWKAYELTGVKIFPPTPQPPKSSALIVEKFYEEEDIGIPRWYVEQIIPGEFLVDGWEKMRYDMEEGQLIDSLGPPPPEGDYEEAFYMIADHSKCCPNNNFKIGCKGDYREPQQYDIEYVRWLMRQLQDEPFRYDWQSVPPPEVVVQSLLDRKTASLHNQLKKREETEYAIRNSLLSMKGKTFGVTPMTVPDLGAIFTGARRY